MAYSLTIDGYTFENPPTGYRKRVDLGNSPQPHYEKTATPFYQSDSQQITLELSGRLNLNDPDDLDELEALQAKAIDGGEVQVDFDPFFSGRGVIEDDPFEQENQVATYEFSIAINEESTNDSAYPAHATPTTGNTFELGDFDFGFDPETVEQEYDRQTERVDRLGGVAHTSDTKGLITRVSLDGRVDGGGQAELWSKARSNALAYLSAEFQNGWALLQSVSIKKDDRTPDYLQGLFEYSAEFLIVKDPSSGIGEVSQFINHDVGDAGTYTSDDDAGSGSDDGGLDFKVLGGTGSIDGRYIDWVTTTVTLADDATNYVHIDDGDQDGVGQVATNTSGFPGTDALPLYEVDTSSGEIVDVRDVRDSLLGEGDDTASDFIFRDEFAIDDTAFSYARIMAFTEALGDPVLAESYLGIAQLSETVADPVEGPLDAVGQASFSETVGLRDGGSATGGGGGGGSIETITFGSTSDWDNSAAESGVVHEGFGDLSGAGVVQLGYPSFDRGGSALRSYYSFDQSSGPVVDETGGGYDLSVSGVTLGQTGLHGTTSALWTNDSDNLSETSDFADGDFSFAVTYYADSGQSWSVDANEVIHYATGGNSPIEVRAESGGEDWAFFLYPGSTTGIRPASGGGPITDAWTTLVGTYNDSDGQMYLYQNGSQIGSANISPQNIGGTSLTNYVGRHQSGYGSSWPGRLENLRIYRRVLSAAEAQAYHDAHTQGSITTPWKTYSYAIDPSTLSLDNVLASVNSQTATVYVESDTNGDGTVDETSSGITLDESGGPYTVSGLATKTSNLRLRIELSTSDVTVSPTFEDGDLVGGTPSGESDQNPNTLWTIDGAIYERSGNEYEGGGVVSKYGG